MPPLVFHPHQHAAPTRNANNKGGWYLSSEIHTGIMSELVKAPSIKFLIKQVILPCLTIQGLVEDVIYVSRGCITMSGGDA